MRRRHAGAQHQGRDHLDHRAGRHPGRHGGAGGAHAGARSRTPRKTELTIKVTGFQWGWNYDYLDNGVAYYSHLDRASDAARELRSGIDPNTVPHYLLNVDQPLVVPVDTKVRLLITGADVIHSWWVPAFGVKKDAIPGFVNEAWFKVDTDKPGLYRGQCAELCGRDHGFMPIVVDVRSQGGLRTPG